MSSQSPTDLLMAGMTLAERKVERRLIEDVVREFEASQEKGLPSHLGVKAVLVELLFSFLSSRVADQFGAIIVLRKQYAEYAKRYSRSVTQQDRERHILDFSREMGATQGQLRGDRKALQRWLGHDTMCERFASRQNMLERTITFGLGRIGALAATILDKECRPLQLTAEWQRLGLEQKLKPFFAYDGDKRVCTAALAALSRAVGALPEEIRERCIEDSTQQFIYRSAMHPRLDVWLQCEAIVLLESLSISSLEKVLRQRLMHPAPGDDLFVRARAVRVLGRNLERLSALVTLIPEVAKDPSPYVRQALAETLRQAPRETAVRWFRHLVHDDPIPQVRSAALLQTGPLLSRDELRRDVLAVLATSFQKEEDPLALRVAIHVAAEVHRQLVDEGESFARTWGKRMMECLDALHAGSENVPVKRYAAQARERIWCESDPRARRLAGTLRKVCRGVPRSESIWLPRELVDPGNPDLTGRVLSTLAQSDFGYDLDLRTGGGRLTRGEVFRGRLWRFLHELRNPSPDKRQAHCHTTGRHFRGSVRAPSSIVCELAETRVPGEPLFIPEEGGWRPYLPLLDDVLSTVSPTGIPRPARVYSSEGVTEIVPPATFKERLRAYFRLSTQFATVAGMRNWRQKAQESPASYLRALRELGFVVRFRPHRMEGGERTSVDQDVARFFPLGLPFLDGDFIYRLHDYFVSVYANSLLDLTLFAGFASSVFLGRHLYANHTVKKWRDNIPLVLGGWGTRGKSGTERLKAALINALGYGLVSKTTGCEAMFLYARPFGTTLEMFLFRSYDKATIWEQRDVIRIANQLGSDVFLWECMALTPSYVEVLQQDWVRDDISTITNTYPDHEDLQGPAGYNIPEVISAFVPAKGKLLTTEEVMLPILEERARKVDAPVRPVTWIESGLLTPDVLQRFPYDEHPSNIALVLALAEELGVARDFALKEMADRVVADLGVLKTYPVSMVHGRKLQFTNGMSANERLGALTNWTRCGFDVQDAVADPGVWISTVVNNRADRIARSRVFASILVQDISADRHFLIGANITGLAGYIRQAWDDHAPTLTLWPEGGDSDPARVLGDMASKFRQPTERTHVLAKLEAMVADLDLHDDVRQSLTCVAEDIPQLKVALAEAGVEENLDAILEHHEENLRLLKEYEAFAERLQNAPTSRRGALDQEFRELLWTWFQRKVVVVEDYFISGDQLIDLIARKSPPGYLNRVLGMQNIKGTGLDYVYRWQAWDACHKACAQLEGQDPQVMEQGLRALSGFHEYGVLCMERVPRTLAAVKSFPAMQSEGSQAELAMIRARYDQAMVSLAIKLKSTRQKTSRIEKLISSVEAFFDAGDAVRRRKLANRIYKDLVAQRISTERAAGELKKLNKRQKGGWLLQKVLTAKQSLARRLGQMVMRGVK